MNQPTPNHPTPPNASFHAPKFEIRYATYAALEKLKSEIWMEFDHEKPTVVVCVWDGAGAVDSINVFTSFESAIDERGADIRVVLREIDGTDLEDQPAIVLFLPTHELQSRVTPDRCGALTDRFIRRLQEQDEETQRIIRSVKRSPVRPGSARPAPPPARTTAERPVFVSGSEPKFPFLSRKQARRAPDELRAPALPPPTTSPVRTALTTLSNEIMRKYPADENHLVICAGEGKSASAAIALYTSLQKAIDEEDLPVRLHIKKLESAFLREMSPIVLTAPTEAIYINVRACDAANIVRRTILKGEILEALTYQDSAGVTSRSLSVKELTDLAAENEPIASRSDEDLPDPIALLIPGKAAFHPDAAELLETPGVKERILFSALTAAAETKPAPRARPQAAASTDGESEFMTVAELFALSDADALRSNGTDAEENDGQDPTVANSNNIHQAFDEILAKSSTVNPPDRPQLLVLYGTVGERGAAQAFAAELREAAGLIDVKVSLSSALGIPNAGVALRIDPAGILYTQLSRGDCDRIVNMTIAGGVVLPEYLMRDGRSGKRYLLYRDIPWIRQQTRLISDDFAAISAESLSAWLNQGGYRGAVRALTARPDENLREIQASHLRGRGGAGFPTWRKMELAAAELAVPKTIVAICAAETAEAILSRAPHAVIEGMIIAGRTIGARKGILALQSCASYTKRVCQKAIHDAESNRLIGSDLLNSGLRFDVEIQAVDEATPAGDESAILAALNRKSPRPTKRPPYPTQSGINGKPTVVLDVRTVCALPVIFRDGAAAFAVEGTRSSGGTQFIRIKTAGRSDALMEIPIGRRLDVLAMNTLSFEERKKITGVRLGDQHGCYLSADQFQLTLDEAAFESIGSPLQTTIEWLDDSTDILARVHADLEAALDRADGENDLYRFGLEALLKSIDRLRAGEFKNDRDLIALRNLAEGIRDSAQTRTHRESLIPILSALACFTAEFRARFAKRRFTAKERNP